MPPKKGGAKDPAEEAAALVADLSAAADAAATAAALAALGTFAEAEGAALVAEGAALAPLLVGALDAGADDEAAANVPALLKRRIEAALEPLVVVPFRS